MNNDREMATQQISASLQMYPGRTGFMTIRGPGQKPWREVLGFPAGAVVTRDMVLIKRRELAKLAHPDAGGSEAQMAKINAAADRALEEIEE